MSSLFERILHGSTPRGLRARIREIFLVHSSLLHSQFFLTPFLIRPHLNDVLSVISRSFPPQLHTSLITQRNLSFYIDFSLFPFNGHYLLSLLGSSRYIYIPPPVGLGGDKMNRLTVWSLRVVWGDSMVQGSCAGEVLPVSFFLFFFGSVPFCSFPPLGASVPRAVVEGFALSASIPFLLFALLSFLGVDVRRPRSGGISAII